MENAALDKHKSDIADLLHAASATRNPRRARRVLRRLDALANLIVDLSLRIDIAKHTLLTHLQVFDTHEGWGATGFTSTATWLAWWIGIGPGAAREHVRVAKALGELKLVDAAFASASSVTPKSAQSPAPPHPRPSRTSSTSTENVRRFVRRTDTRSGMVRIEMQLPPEQANVVWDAMNAALDSGRREAKDVSAETPADANPDVSAETPARETSPVVLQAERADAMVSVAQGYLQHQPRTLGSGYELVVMTTKDQLEHGPGGIGGFLRDGTPVPLHIARMLACDCTRVDVDLSESGEILDVGRARRTIPSAIGRALWLRDGGCRVPGCGRKHHLHAHHIEAWADGGETSKSNLVLLCPSHHALVHEGQLFVDTRDGKIEFRNAYGLQLRPSPQRNVDFPVFGTALGMHMLVPEQLPDPPAEPLTVRSCRSSIPRRARC